MSLSNLALIERLAPSFRKLDRSKDALVRSECLYLSHLATVRSLAPRVEANPHELFRLGRAAICAGRAKQSADVARSDIEYFTQDINAILDDSSILRTGC